MNKKRLMLTGAAVAFALTTLCSVRLYAHQVALKNGFVVHFQKYRLAANNLYYLGDDGKEVSVPLSTINMELTQQLTAAEKTPLKLPGMSATKATNGDGQPPSLGELAQRLRSGDAKTTNQRVFTDDNFSHTVSADALPGAPSTKNAETTFHDAEAAISKLEDKTEKELGNDVAGDTQFPRRSVWEGKLYAEKQQVIAAARDVLAVAKSNATDGVKNSALSKFNWEMEKYNDLKAEGIGQAADWERKTERNVKP